MEHKLIEVANAAAWLEETHKLYCSYFPGVWVSEEIIWQEWAGECEDPETAMRYIREQRAAKELKQTVTEAWADLQFALMEAGYSLE